jgi:hypothetical protein
LYDFIDRPLQQLTAVLLLSGSTKVNRFGIRLIQRASSHYQHYEIAGLPISLNFAI